MSDNFVTTEIINKDFPDFGVMMNAFPELSARLLGYIGKKAAVELAGMMEAGQQGVKFRDMSENRKSKGGRRMITYSVGKGANQARVSSFPLNLFEGGRTLRSDKREKSRNILRRTLRNAMNDKMASALSEAAELVADDWFNKNKKGGMKSL